MRVGVQIGIFRGPYLGCYTASGYCLELLHRERGQIGFTTFSFYCPVDRLDVDNFANDWPDEWCA